MEELLLISPVCALDLKLDTELLLVWLHLLDLLYLPHGLVCQHLL